MINEEWKKAKEFYDNLVLNNGYPYMSMIWTISCIEESLQAYDMDLIVTDKDKERMCKLVLNGWLDTEYNIGISKIADIVVEHWDDFKDGEDGEELLQDLIADEIGL